MSENRHRKKKLNVWLVDEEYELLKEKADKSDMSMSAYIRSIILLGGIRGGVVNFSKDDADKIIYELNRIGNNVNQIAYYTNAKSTVNENDFEQLIGFFDQFLGEFHRWVKYSK